MKYISGIADEGVFVYDTENLTRTIYSVEDFSKLVKDGTKIANLDMNLGIAVYDVEVASFVFMLYTLRDSSGRSKGSFYDIRDIVCYDKHWFHRYLLSCKNDNLMLSECKILNRLYCNGGVYELKCEEIYAVYSSNGLIYADVGDGTIGFTGNHKGVSPLQFRKEVLLQ